MSSSSDSIDISDAKVSEAFKAVCNEKEATNWMAATVNDGKLELLESGTGGFGELKRK
jgi:hypothetical protein